jgi:hypothetical protein
MKYVRMKPKMKHSNSLHGSRKGAFIAGFVDGIEAPITLFRWHNTTLYLKTPNQFSEKKAWESATRYLLIGFKTQQNDRQPRRISQK